MINMNQSIGENVMRTTVVEKGGMWWFKWRNAIPGAPPVGKDEGPFATKEAAESARQRFEQERRPNHSWEQTLSE